MTTFYLDPEDGNDANDGESFANRWKTFGSGATTARIAAGDEIRIIASRTPSSVGNATWVDNTDTITLAGAKTLEIDNCQTAWTASANVTCSTNASRREGTLSASFAIASGFTTGKVAYRTITSLDLSAYEAVSFLFNSSTTFNSGVFELRLCSDTTGTTAVFTIPLRGKGNVSAGWLADFKDNAGALSSAVQSIAIYAISDPGTFTLYLDNIIACKSKGHADHISHYCLFGKNTEDEPMWYPITAISGSGLTLRTGPKESSYNTASTTTYRSVSETVTTYILTPILDFQIDPATRIQDSGFNGSPIRYTGGWDRTAMSAQSGETWLSGGADTTYCINVLTRTYIELENMGFIGYTTAAINGGGTVLDMDLLGFIDCTTGINCAQAGGYTSLTLGYANMCTPLDTNVTLADTRGALIANIGKIANQSKTGSAYGAISSLYLQYGGLPGRFELNIGEINNCYRGLYGGGAGVFRLRGTHFANNTVDFEPRGAAFYLDSCTFASSPNLTMTTTLPNTCGVFMTNINNDPTDNRTYRANATFRTATDELYDDSTLSWKLNITDTVIYKENAPFVAPLGRILCPAGFVTTVTVWIKRDDEDLHLGLGVMSDALQGVTATSDWAEVFDYELEEQDWEQLSISITPTVDGVVEVMAQAWTLSAFANGWYSTLNYSRAPV